MDRNAYDILGVSRTAPPEVMKAAKTALSKIYHPDSGSAPDSQAMARVNEAYDTLTDPDRRATLDSFLASGSDETSAGDGSDGWGDEPSTPASGNEGWGDEAPDVHAAGAAPWGATESPPPYVPTVAVSNQFQTPHEQGWSSALHLAHAVHSGHALPRYETTLILGHGEIFHCQVSAEMAAFYSLDDASYTSHSFIAGRTLKGLAVTGAASMLYNSHNKRKAERQAAAQWRRAGIVPLHVTNQRLLIDHDGQLESYWFQGGLVSFDPQFRQYSMMLQADGGPLLHFSGPAVPYVAVMLHVLLQRGVPVL